MLFGTAITPWNFTDAWILLLSTRCTLWIFLIKKKKKTSLLAYVEICVDCREQQPWSFPPNKTNLFLLSQTQISFLNKFM